MERMENRAHFYFWDYRIFYLSFNAVLTCSYLPRFFWKKIFLVEHDETEGSVQLLVREFLQNRENGKFGYFVYLIFAEQTQAAYNKRLAAAEAFMCQYATRSKALDLGLKQSSLVAFYVPVKNRTDRHRLARLPSAKSLLKEYHYSGADFLLRQLRVRSTRSEERFDFTIGIVGSPVPLMTSMAEVDTDMVEVLRLDKKSPHQIAKIITVFRNGLTTWIEGKNGSRPTVVSDWSARVQNYFMTVNSMKFPVRPETEEGADVCR